MRKLAFLAQACGVGFIIAGVAFFSIPVACVVLGVLLITAGEVHG